MDKRYPIIIRPNVFKDKLYLSIRKFNSWEDQITHPTTKGIEIPWEEAREVIAAMEAVIDDFGGGEQAILEVSTDELPF